MASMSYRIYESNTLSKRKELRRILITQFCAILFNRRFDTIGEILRNERTLIVNTTGYIHRHPAIQYWFGKLNLRYSNVIDFIESEDAKAEGLKFIHKNSSAGHCTCRYTMSALFADRFRITVYIYEGKYCTEPIKISPPERNTNNMRISAIRKQTNNKEYFVYIWYDEKSFHLLLPRRHPSQDGLYYSTLDAQTMSWFRKGVTTTHVKETDNDVKYCLVRSFEGEVHHITYFAPPVDSQYDVHVAVVPQNEEWRRQREQFYMILPPKRLRQMYIHIPKGKQLYVYCCGEEERMAYKIGNMSNDGDKAIFQLAHDIALIMVVMASNVDEADYAIVEEMKIKVRRPL
jgi:hypothetical protein